VTGFAAALRNVAQRVPESRVLMVMATDGIPIEKLVIHADPNMEAVAAEYTSLLRASLSAAADTGLGQLRELAVHTEKMIALLVSITPEYFIFAALQPDAIVGRARFALRMAGMALESEFQ
jgi:predicted regulator of Ras-like GTPase activity (Roadblock/LC7/MglB family)